MKFIGGRHTIFVTGNQGIKKLLDFGEKFVVSLSTLLAWLVFFVHIMLTTRANTASCLTSVVC